MNLGQIRSKVRSNLQEPTAVFFSDADINDWINEGYMKYILKAINLKREVWITSVSIDWVSGQSTYALPTTHLKIDRVQRIFAGRAVPLKKKHRQETPTAVLGVGVIYPNYDIVNDTIVFEPTPSTSEVGAVTVDYVYSPARLVNDADNPDAIFADIYHDMLVNFATAKGLAKERDYPAAATYTAYLADMEPDFLAAFRDDEVREWVEPFVSREAGWGKG